MSEEVTRVYEFGAFRLDAADGRLLRDGQAVPLAPKAFEALVALVESDGRTLSRDDLINRLWPESFVEEGNLKVTIFKLRKALGEHDGQEQYIETIPRRGYRFIVPVRVHEVAPARLILEKRTTSHVLIEQEEAPDPPQVGTVTAAPGALRRRLHKRAWALGLLLVALCAAVVSYRLLGNQRQTGTAPGPRSIAVLPFKSLNADEGDDYLGLGMADTLITKLSRLRQVIVRSTGAVRRYGGGEQDPVAAGRELKVEAVLEGSIQRSGERLRLTVRLVRVSDGESLWADIFAADFKDVFRVQDSVSERVAAALALTLSGEERQQLTKRYTDSTEAYQLYLKGRYYWNRRSPAAIKKGVEYFGQAIALDTDYALAYAGLADSYVMLGKDWHAQAKAAAARALELDEQLAEAHTSLALLAMRSEWNWAVAEKELLRALELNPNYATANQWYSIYLELTGHPEEAVAEARRAQSLDPLSLIINNSLGDRLYYARQYDDAFAHLRRTVEMDPEFAETHGSLGHVYLQRKMTDEAVAEFKRERELSGSRLALASLGQAYARSGRAGAARRVIAELESQLPSGLASPDYIAGIYMSLGDKEAALRWLERAYEARSDLLVFVRVDPIWDDLRADPRFQDLLRRIGLG
jgi:TolB-like protein/DNA-binding winged helix-turn-helix (wHTH) protein